MADEKPTQDVIHERSAVTPAHEWVHTAPGDCDRGMYPVYSDPNRVPEPCGGQRAVSGTPCQNEDWTKTGRVLRDGSGNIVHREK